MKETRMTAMEELKRCAVPAMLGFADGAGIKDFDKTTKREDTALLIFGFIDMAANISLLYGPIAWISRALYTPIAYFGVKKATEIAYKIKK